ncbi:MAG: LysR family transcriptional regulator [Alphaproteobacteria bacterium]|jgi:molybdate transport system regulatory protein|nr:LysR family transcriptional regulator [Alphaproteobacteria bacterium]
MAELFLRIDLGAERLLGPGKVRLLELIDRLGSIAAAGRAMGMSYRRAWLLVDEMNGAFRQPVVAKKHGGRAGGGATVTDFGREVVQRYRAIETEAQAAVAGHLQALQAEAAPCEAAPQEAAPQEAGPADRPADCAGGTGHDTSPAAGRCHRSG